MNTREGFLNEGVVPLVICTELYKIHTCTVHNMCTHIRARVCSVFMHGCVLMSILCVLVCEHEGM